VPLGASNEQDADAQRLLVNARRALRRAHLKAQRLVTSGGRDPGVGRRRGRLRRAVKDLAELLDLTHRIAAQTRQRLSGTIPDGSRRRVSPRDPDARPIAQGRRGKPVEFGYQPQGADNEDGVVLDHSVHLGNAPEAPSSPLPPNASPPA
jgi:transposase, IS5 family